MYALRPGGSSVALGVLGASVGAGEAVSSSSFLPRSFRSSLILARTLGEAWVLRGSGGLWGEPSAGLGDAGRALGVAGDEGRFFGL